MTAKQIIQKLEETGLTRKEIAEKIGVSFTTINGWMPEKSIRPIPATVEKLLEKIWSDLHGDGDLRFTYKETQIINQAIPLSGCKTFPEFAHHSIMSKAKQLTTEAADDLAAEREKASKSKDKKTS